MVGAAPRVSYDALSSGLHGVLMFFATCSVAGWPRLSAALKYSTTAVVSGEPVMRSARTNARRRIAASRHARSGCNQAPRPGSFLAWSTVTAYSPFPSTATTRSSSTASSRFRQPTHVRTGPFWPSVADRASAAEVSRWITAESTVYLLAIRNGGAGLAVAHRPLRRVGVRLGLAGRRRIASDVDPPAGQPGRQPRGRPASSSRISNCRWQSARRARTRGWRPG